MALTDGEKQSIYMACGLHAGGGTRYRIIFSPDGFALWNTTSTSSTWDYSAIKTILDAQIALLAAAAIVKVQAFVVTFDATQTSSFKKTSGADGVLLDDAEECELARKAIVSLVGVEVEPVRFGDSESGGRSGSVVC